MRSGSAGSKRPGVYLLKCPAGAGGQQRHALLRVGQVRSEDLRGIPVVQDLVVVPDHELRHRRVEPADVLVEQVVAMVPAELVERLGDLALFERHEVLPDAPVVQLDLRLQGTVGVNRVAGVDEHVGVRGAHRVVEPHAAHVGVDAPALADRVGRPGDRHIARRRGRRRGREGAGDRLAPDAQVLQALKPRAIEDALARAQAGQIDARGEVARFERGRTHDAAHVRKRPGGRILDDEPRGTVGAAPDHRAIAVHVARRDAVLDGWPRRFRRHDRRRLAEHLAPIAKRGARQRDGGRPSKERAPIEAAFAHNRATEFWNFRT